MNCVEKKCARCHNVRAIKDGEIRCVRCIEGGREYYRRNRERILAKQASEHGKALSRERKRREYQRKRDVLIARVKAWASKNRETIRRYQSSPQMRVHSNVSRAIRSALRLGKSGRKWETLVGYSRADLMAHLESRFQPGMTWENYGQWEIDHIRPRSSFRFETAEDQQFRECWALSNLQPLWMQENRSKHAKVAA